MGKIRNMITRSPDAFLSGVIHALHLIQFFFSFDIFEWNCLDIRVINVVIWYLRFGDLMNCNQIILSLDISTSLSSKWWSMEKLFSLLLNICYIGYIKLINLLLEQFSTSIIFNNFTSDWIHGMLQIIT